MVNISWYTKKIVGYHTDIQCRSCHWLEALDEAVECEFPDGVREKGLSLMSDNGNQPTSVAFMKSCCEMDTSLVWEALGSTLLILPDQVSLQS